ncbi:MAG: phosphatase PAP2 family protein [Candidatus Saccharicenans sp.]|nr:phosphatase PAP2 family protein [Candidatus Saccharicenans sp.]
MRGLIYYLTSRYQRPVYCEYAVKIETAIFGQVPSVWLQSRLLPDGQTGWLEQTLTFFHGTHFIAFLIVGFLIWLKDKGHFKNYKTSFYLLLASGISLYALVPTAPPWMASNMFGLLPKLAHFNIDIYTAYIPDLTAGFNTDPVAAMPSLHAAFPFLCSLLLWKIFRLKALPFYIYTAIIFFTIIYTGDHYVIDIIAGVGLALLSFCLSRFHSHKKPPNDHSFIMAQKSEPNKVQLLIGIFIIAFSLLTGPFIKPGLKTYYADFSHLYFPDFIKHPKKAESNYYIASYLGDFFRHNLAREKARKFYKMAIELAPTAYERAIVEKKLADL